MCFCWKMSWVKLRVKAHRHPRAVGVYACSPASFAVTSILDPPDETNYRCSSSAVFFFFFKSSPPSWCRKAAQRSRSCRKSSPHPLPQRFTSSTKGTHAFQLSREYPTMHHQQQLHREREERLPGAKSMGKAFLEGAAYLQPGSLL